MATNITITEYSSLGQMQGGLGQIPEEVEITTQFLTSSGSNQRSAALNPATRFVRINTDGGGGSVGVCIAFGQGTVGTPPTPTATTSSQRMSPNMTEYKAVPYNGQQSGNNQIVYKIAYITAAT